MFATLIDTISSFMYSKLLIILLLAGKNPTFHASSVGLEGKLDFWE